MTVKKKPIPQALRNAKLPEKTVTICLDPALAEEYDEVQRTTVGSDSLAPDRSRLEELKEQIREASLDVKMRGLTRRAYTELTAQHPVREGSADDRHAGFNVDTFYVALIRACTVSPDMDDEGWDLMDESLTNGEWLRLSVAAIGLNQHSGSVPFS